MRFTKSDRWFVPFFLVVLGLGGLVGSAQDSKELGKISKGSVPGSKNLGISRSQPTQGRYFRYQGVYLTSYSFEIPGTEVVVEMVPVPAGKFAFEVLDKSGKKKMVEVKVEPFWIAKTETTWQQYQPFMKLDTAFRRFDQLKIRQITDKNKADSVSAPSAIYDVDWRVNDFGGFPKHPAATISQFGAKCFTKYLTKVTGQPYRLPSAVEWKYAAAASIQPEERKKITEVQLNKIAWFSANSKEQRNLVGKKEPNRWGIHDMLGNVAEWVLDGHQYDDSIFAGRRINSLSAVAWPTEYRKRLALGGSFMSAPGDCQIDSSLLSSDGLWEDDPNLPTSTHWLASDAGQGIGFRVMRPFNSEISQDLAAKYWEPDHKEIKSAVKSSLESSGHVVEGIVDPSLPNAIKKLPAKKIRRR